jgi:single-stranded DNA-specific DHH superfamily exonuclease
MKILVVDHHRLKENSEYGRSDIVNPHLFKIPEYLNPPTAYLAYLICDNLDWVGALGVVADKGHPSCPNFLKQMQKKYDVDFEVLKNYTNAADVLRDSEYIVTALLEAKIPQDLLKNKKLVAYEDEFRKEVTRLMDIHKEKARFFEDAKLVIYDIDTKYSLRGGIANTLQEKYKGWTVIIGDEQGDHYAMSLRTTSHDVDLVSTIKKSISTLKDAFGGGHAKASGCKVLLKDKERFIETFIRLLNEINT